MAKTKIVYRYRTRRASRGYGFVKRASKSRAGKGIFKNWGKISAGIGGLIALNQITDQDMRTVDSASAETKFKTFVNSLIGRTVGYRVFSKNGEGTTMPRYAPTWNFGGIFNKYTGVGAAMMLYSKAPVRLPLKGKLGTLGKNVLAGGAIGGIFSPAGDRSTVLGN